MPKLAPTAANVRFVAEEIAKEKGSREAVALGDLRPLIRGSGAEVEGHLHAWRAGPVAGNEDLQRMMDELERRMTGAIEASGRRAASRPDGRLARGTAEPLRNATRKELDTVVRIAVSGEQPETRNRFLKHVIEAAPPPKPRATRRPEGAPRHPRTKIRRPDTPKAVRRDRAAVRLQAVKDAVVSPVRTLRRVRDADWKGASSSLAGQQAARALRNAGYPMMPTELANHIRERGGVDFRKPARDLPLALLGSPMVQVGGRAQFWFEGEDPPDRPTPPTRLDTAEARNRELARIAFERVLAILQRDAPAGVTVNALKRELGDDIRDFNRDWLAQRLKRAAADPDSNVRKTEPGYGWIADKKPKARRK